MSDIVSRKLAHRTVNFVPSVKMESETPAKGLEVEEMACEDIPLPPERETSFPTLWTKDVVAVDIIKEEDEGSAEVAPVDKTDGSKMPAVDEPTIKSEESEREGLVVTMKSESEQCLIEATIKVKKATLVSYNSSATESD